MNLYFEVWFSQCGRKHDRSQVTVYQLLLCILDKMFKHIPIYFYKHTHTHNSSNNNIRGLEFYKGTCCKIKVFV